ncbi:MAG: nucleoside deaminase [Deltaproteobacteria bacterium]|nr:nucleoside deaminase [Deltaproteobacteria bacterium]
MNGVQTLSEFLRGAQPTISLPNWLSDPSTMASRFAPTDEGRMAFAIELSRSNVTHGTGGPFGTTIFDLNTGRLLGVGVNRVVPTNDPTAHGEMVAIRLACAFVEKFSLGQEGLKVGLYTSAEPCGMCCTGVLWAGVSALFCAATTRDVEKIVGFDEGLKPRNWRYGLAHRGVEVASQLLRTQAVEVLQAYKDGGGAVYNGR